MGQFSDQFNAVVDSAQNPQANANLTAGVSSNPDAVATNLQLGRRFGVHPDVVAAMQDDFKQRAASEDAQVQVADAPKTAAYIAADPVRAQVSHDDVGILGTLENTLEGYGQSMLNHFGMAVNALRGVATNPTTGIDIAKNAPAALASGAVSQAAGFAGAAKLAGDASGAVDYTQGIQQRLFGGTVEGKMSSYFGAKATTLAGEAAALAPNPTGNYVADQSLGMVQSLPGVVVALGGGMGARAMGWSAEAASALGALSMGVPSAGGFYQKATDAGVSPLKAGIGAVAEGAAMTAAGYAGELPFIKATDAGAPLIMRYLQSQIPEQAGMQGANLVNQFTDWSVLPENKDKTVGDFLESLPASAATTAIQVGALGAITNFGAAGVERALGTAGHQARLDAAAAADTGAMHDGIKNIMDLAAQSKTRERDPASFQQFMQAQVEDGPLEHVYVDGKTLAQTLSDAGPEGADLAARLPSVQEQLSEAAASGGEVRIPTAELATALPGHALEQKILGDIRVDPLADSANESKVKQDEAVDRTQQAFEKELQVSADDNAFQRSRDNVVQGFVNKLGDTGRFTRDVNQKYGQLLGDFYATQAQRLGIAPEEMAARYPLDIRSQLGDESPDEQQTNQPKGDTLLNVGLARPDGQPDNTPEQVQAAIEKHGGTVTESATHQSDTENTVVARLDKPLTPEQAHAVSADLGQEAIGQHTAGAGELHGPGAEAWRPFNPDYFLKMDGTRLGDEELRTGAEPLEGLPKNAVGPMPEARRAAEDYTSKAELPYSPPRDYVKVDRSRAERIARAFEEMKHDPSDPLVKASYDAMIAETLAQWEHIKSTGLKVEFIDGDDPYKEQGPRGAILDVRENNHLWVYPTSDGFGSSDLDVSDNPLLQTVPGETISGRDVQANDIFRIVHDYFGHIKEGVGFRADGEENAWRSHSAMYSPLARQAMTTETRGQNSWVNFGPHGETNRTASGSDTIYAPQKIGLLPQWVSEEGAGNAPTQRLDQSSNKVVDDATQKLIDKVPGYAGVAPYLTPEERATVRAASAKKMTDLFESFPSAEEMASVAWSGRAKRGWYERSANALLDIFGANDAPRFAALLAALSPQTSVESNAINAVKSWVNWDQAGRPTDKQAIIEILGKSVQGGKGVGSVLNAWINNSVRALQSADGNVQLSGPKVNSFMDNLVGVTDEVTNDAWMANYAAIDQGVFAGQDPKKTGVKGKSAGYKTFSALARKAAEIVSTRTGESWTPAEIQETVWSWTKTLYEARDKGADTSKTTNEILAAGGLTHEMIANTPDFATLFAQGVYRRVLEFGGYGDKLGNEGSDRGSDGPHGAEGSAAESEGAGISADAFQSHIDEAARRLETLRAQRRGAAEPDEQQTLFQHASPDIERELGVAGISHSIVRRASDGTILVGVEPFYSSAFHLSRLESRAAELSGRIGQQIEVVPDTDPRLKDGAPVSHDAPPVNADGNVELQHFGPAGLTRTDPSKWGTNFNTLPPSERARLGTDLGRTYFGIATGEPGGYINEFGGGHAYTAEVPASKIYDIMGDPDGLRLTGVSNYERAIKAAGYDGYWVKNGELGLVATMFNPVDVKPAPGLIQQRAAQQARGHLTFGNDVTKQPSTITLLRNADLSTFLHESGHFFLEVMSHMAASPDAPESVKSDFAKTLKFMGTDAATWAGSDFEAKREGHEKFARGFEAYLFEGKAPSEGMRGVFQHFKSWLVSVYRNNIANLNVKLNPDIRGVFDRLIASDDAIKAAEGEAGLIAQFPTKPDAMSDAEWSDYQKLGDAAHQTAVDSLQTASIRDMRFASRAKDEALKRLQGEVAEKRAAVESEVRGEIESKPVYRAQDYMRRGLLDGEKQDGPTKMSRPELKAQYQLADDAFWNDLKGMTSTENGVHPMQIAELFGFGSVDEMIRALRSAPDRKELIDGETDSRMLERYGDITSPQALDRAASAAIHNEVRGRMVATELREGQKALLAGHTNENGNPSARVLAKAAKRYAEGVVSRLKVRDVRPAQFEGAERRAAAAATKALSKGDSQGFVTEKRNQLLNFHLVREARGAQDTIQKTIDYFRKFAKPGTRDAIDRSYLDQIDGMLDRFDFRTGVTDKALAARKTLASWIEAQRALGLEPNIDPAMENEANRQSYKDMTMDELKGLRDSVKNIEHLGRLKDKLLKNKAERDLGVVVDAVRNGIIEKSYGTEREQPFGAKTWAQKAKQGVFEVLTTLRKLSSLAREMDGNEDGGPVWEHLIRPLNDASVDEQARLIDATTKLKKIFADMGDRRPWVSEYEPAIGQSLTHEGRLMMALNWGNDLNRQRLMDGNHLTQDQVEGALAKLSKQDWDFVQGVWRHIDSHWGDISAQALRMDGVAPEKQEGVQFAQKSADGHDLQIDGGYFPLKYDADKDGKIDAYKDADIAQAMTRAAFTRSTTRRGFLKERAEKVEHPLRLDFGVIFQHHAEVIHDLAYRETLTDANRILGRTDGAIRQHYGPEVARAFKKTYEDIAAGSMGARNAYDKGIAYLRSGVTTAGIAWNTWTGIFHLTGFANSVARVGIGNTARGIARFFGDASKMTLTSNWVYEQSDYMKQRATTQSKHLSELSNRYDAKGPIGSQIARIPGSTEAGEFLHRSFHAFIDRALRITSVPTWSGAYLDAVDKGEQHERAVAIADQAVRDSHGDGDMQNTAEAMRSKGVTSLFTSFMMWFSTAYNQMTESNKLAVKNPSPTTIAKAASDFLLIAIAPAATLSVLHGLYNGDDKKKIAHKVEGEVAGGLLSFFPYLRELSPVVAAGVSGEPVRDYQGPAGTRFIQAMTEAAKQMQHDGMTAKLLPSANAAAGVLFHYPAAQVQRTASGVMALADGKSKNPTAVMFGPPPKK